MVDIETVLSVVQEGSQAYPTIHSQRCRYNHCGVAGTEEEMQGADRAGCGKACPLSINNFDFDL